MSEIETTTTVTPSEAEVKKAATKAAREHYNSEVEAMLEEVYSGNGREFFQNLHSIEALRPVNGVTGKRYNGANKSSLAWKMKRRGFTDPRWITKKQAEKLKLAIKEGESGTYIACFFPVKRTIMLVEAAGKVTGTKTVTSTNYFYKCYEIFNYDQLEGEKKSYISSIAKAGFLKNIEENLKHAGITVAPSSEYPVAEYDEITKILHIPNDVSTDEEILQNSFEGLYEVMYASYAPKDARMEKVKGLVAAIAAVTLCGNDSIVISDEFADRLTESISIWKDEMINNKVLAKTVYKDSTALIDRFSKKEA